MFKYFFGLGEGIEYYVVYEDSRRKSYYDGVTIVNTDRYLNLRYILWNGNIIPPSVKSPNLNLLAVL